MTTFASFIARFPEFGAIKVTAPVTVESVCQIALDDADAFLSNTAFGPLRDKAVCLVAAHRTALRYDVSSGGVISQNTPGVATSLTADTGSLSQVTSVSAMVIGKDPFKADYARTSYGLEFLSMVDVSMAGGNAVY